MEGKDNIVKEKVIKIYSICKNILFKGGINVKFFNKGKLINKDFLLLGYMCKILFILFYIF